MSYKRIDDELNTSTPKRRRLGPGNILRSAFRNIQKSKSVDYKSDDSLPNSPTTITELQTNEGEFLPCNQVEFLSDSGNNSSICSEIANTPGSFNTSVLRNIENWESFRIRDDNHKDFTSIMNTGIQEQIENISDDMFQSKLEQELILDSHANVEVPENFRQQIEHSFQLINESICGNNKNENSLFETKDSFLLDIRESDLILEKENKIEFCKPLPNLNDAKNSFYGLPISTKELFKAYRNIETLYEWQEQCLDLDAIKEKRNLIYALPTSGGKTLVAEVLMLREVLCNKKNVLFILPFVAIVQEKIWALSPFAVQLNFLVEEYAAGKGHLPPKKRRNKNSIYIATIEKGLALVRNLIELDRLHEIGLIVVDELHLIGEPGRGGTLETLLTTVIFANKGIQIVGMSATIGNLPSLAEFLRADVFQRDFRPVELTEYVKLGNMLHRLTWKADGVEVLPERSVINDYNPSEIALDPDRVCALVREVFPASCLVFCATKRNCENVAAMLCKMATKEMLSHRAQERQALAAALEREGCSAATTRAVTAGAAPHHAGLAADERALLEHAYRTSVINVLCCTSTLAAGVNLPAQRVIIRAPRQGREFITLAVYKQMVGRAGRAGVCNAGESIIICEDRDWPQLHRTFASGLPPVRSSLAYPQIISGLLLSTVALQIANTREKCRTVLDKTLLAVQEDSATIKQLCDDTLRSLIQSGAIEPVHKQTDKDLDVDNSHIQVHGRNVYLYNDSEFKVSALGNAAIKGCMDLSTAKQLLKDLETASRGVVLLGSLHLLYLVTPHDAAGIRPDYRHYYSLYCSLDEEGIQTAKALGITEMNAIRMMTGKPITNVSEIVLRRFYLALALRDLWRQAPLHYVADKYAIGRGAVQSLMTSCASFAASAHKLCSLSERSWMFAAMLAELAPRLQHCAAPHLDKLMDLPNVRKARALQLVKAGYKSVEDIAKASPEDMAAKINHLSRTAATHLISAARMSLIEKVENLRAEVEDVMVELNM